MSNPSVATSILRVNLLDWRARRRENRQKQFLVVLGAAALSGVAVCAAVLIVYNAQLSNQQDRNTRLKSEITQMEVKIKEIKDLEKVRDDLIARTQVIEKLQQSRAETVHFFDDLVSSVPEGLYLTKVSQRGEEAQISGMAESNGRVSTYIRNLESASWLHKPRLEFIRAKTRDNRRFSEFSLRVRVGAKPTKSDGEETIFE